MLATVSHQNSVNGEYASCSREESPVHPVSIDNEILTQTNKRKNQRYRLIVEMYHVARHLNLQTFPKKSIFTICNK